MVKFEKHLLRWKLIFLAFILTACTGVQFATPTRILNVFSPTSTTSISPTMFPAETKKVIPDVTRTPTVFAAITPIPSQEYPTPTIPPDLPERITLDYQKLSDFGWSQSLGHKWLVEVRMNETGNYLLFIPQDGSAEWVLDLASESSIKIYYFEGWSADENFVYVRFVNRNSPSSPPPGPYCTPGQIYRVDLRNHKATILVEFEGDNSCMAAKFSPDASWFAYIPPHQKQQQIIVMNLETGQKISYFLSEAYWGAGYLAWSPDGNRLLVTASQGSLNADPQSSHISLFLVINRANRLDVKEVLWRKEYFYIYRWNNEQVFVEDNTGPFWLNLNSGDIIRIIPTPTPTTKLSFNYF